MKRYVLKTYMADKGSCVINGVSFNNGIGDGEYRVIVCDEQPPKVQELAWIDLRDVPTVNIWGYDCDASSAEPFSPVDFYNAQGIGIGISQYKKYQGDIFIWKMF